MPDQTEQLARRIADALEPLIAMVREGQFRYEKPMELVRNTIASELAPVLAESGWIKCSERMPEVDTVVLFSVGGTFPKLGVRRNDYWWLTLEQDKVVSGMIPCWQPLPAPPVEEQR